MTPNKDSTSYDLCSLLIVSPSIAKPRKIMIFPFEKTQKNKKNHLENWKPYQLTSVPQITHTTRQTTGAKNVLINLIKENSAEIST